MAARTQKLRVYVTRIGLTRWAVAAPSQKAALAAWDVRENLFATGAAQATDDARAVELAMKTPGKPVALDRQEARAEMGRVIRLDDHRQKLAAKKTAPPSLRSVPRPEPKAPEPKLPEPKPLSKAKLETRPKPKPKPLSKAPPPPSQKPSRPKPDRSRLTAAEDELRIFQKRAIRDRSELIREREALEMKAQVLEARIEAEEKRLKGAIERERQRFEAPSDD